MQAARKALVQAGYEDCGEMGVPSRVAMRQPVDTLLDSLASSTEMRTGKGEEFKMMMNTYVILDGSLSLRNHLDLKRMLLEDEGLREEYAEVKRRLVDDEGIDDVDVYCKGKNEVILRILIKAGWSEWELEEVRKANE